MTSPLRSGGWFPAAGVLTTTATALADRTVLVVGASGILAPLVHALVSKRSHVVAVSRPPGVPPAPGRGDGAPLGRDDRAPTHGSPRVIGADTTTLAGAWAVANCGPLDYAVFYGPALTAQTLAVLTNAVRYRAVLVLTSEAAAPTGPGDEGAGLAPLAARYRARPQDAVVLLGWKSVDRGRSRWHTPGEVSAAALEALEGYGDVLLGRVRPWEQRPR